MRIPDVDSSLLPTIDTVSVRHSWTYDVESLWLIIVCYIILVNTINRSFYIAPGHRDGTMDTSRANLIVNNKFLLNRCSQSWLFLHRLWFVQSFY